MSPPQRKERGRKDEKEKRIDEEREGGREVVLQGQTFSTSGPARGEREEGRRAGEMVGRQG